MMRQRFPPMGRMHPMMPRRDTRKDQPQGENEGGNIPEEGKMEEAIVHQEGGVEPTHHEVRQGQGQDEGGKEENKKKMRCKKWPLCKSDSCEYHHPSETVYK